MNTLFLAALLAAALACLATASSKEQDELPPDIEILYDAGQYPQAADALEAALKQDPQDAPLDYWLGRALFEVRDFSPAIASFERAVKIEPDRSEYHEWLGRACGRKAEENSHSNMPAALPFARRAHREFEVAVQLDAANVNAQRDLIAFIANAPGTLGGGEEQALKQIHALSTVDAIEGTLALADLYAVRKKFDQADEQYQRVLDSAPDRIDVYFEVADYCRDRGDSERMEQAVNGGTRIAPSDRRLTYYRGVALVLAKRDSGVAEENLRAYIDSVPDNSELPSHASAYEWLGKLYENEEKPELAAQQYRAALTLDPHNKALQEALKKLRKK